MASSRNECNSCPEITCVSTKQVLQQDIAKNVVTAYDRLQNRGMSACLFGSGGTCCRHCNMGPCQIIDGVDDMLGSVVQLPILLRQGILAESVRRAHQPIRIMPGKWSKVLLLLPKVKHPMRSKMFASFTC